MKKNPPVWRVNLPLRRVNLLRTILQKPANSLKGNSFNGSRLMTGQLASMKKLGQQLVVGYK